MCSFQRQESLLQRSLLQESLFRQEYHRSFAQEYGAVYLTGDAFSIPLSLMANGSAVDRVA